MDYSQYMNIEKKGRKKNCINLNSQAKVKGVKKTAYMDYSQYMNIEKKGRKKKTVQI